MEKYVLSPPRAAELRLLYAEYAEAAAKASMVLSFDGAESHKFFEADKAVDVLWKRIRGILGMAIEGW